MSKLNIWYENKTLYIKKERVRTTELDYQEVHLDKVYYGRKYPLYVMPTKKGQINKLLYMYSFTKEEGISFINEHKIDWNEEQVIAVYTVDGNMFYTLYRKANAYKKMIKFYYKMLHVRFTPKKAIFWIMGQYINPMGVEFTDERICLDADNSVSCHFPAEKRKKRIRQMLKPKYIQRVSFSLPDALEKNQEINSFVQLKINIDGCDVDYYIGKKDRFISSTRYYYAPYKSAYVKDFALHLRRTIGGNFVLVKRKMEDVEKTLFFRFMESKPVSWLLYKTGKLFHRFRKKHINLFYEKLSMQAEEGTFEFFERVRDKSEKSKNYFIIDEHSKDYDRIKDAKNVVRKFSLKYYYLLYNAKNYIATESPVHLNILRSNNKYFRLCTCENDFIFLQHGVTYMKCQGDGSAFGKGKEGEPQYMVVDSEKEKDVCVDMLGLSEEQMLKTGMLIFDDIVYKHINQESEDIITIMLTWKPYEEHLYNFEESTYYQFILDIYDVVSKYADPEKIMFVPHPKIAHLLRKTSMKDRIWMKSIKEVLAITKLLITDYSSVAYNCFYQGAGVIFYQPDLEVYELENGPLIPKDEEYIGYRVFEPNALNALCERGFEERQILMDYWRKPEFEERYLTINEFHDGKNADRIYKKLEKLGKV